MPSPTENQGRDTGTEPVEQKSRKGVEKGYGGERGRDAPRQPVPGEGVSFWHQLAGAYATSIKEQNEVGRHMQKSLAQAEREFVHETEQLRLESWPSVQEAYVRLLEAKPSDIEGLLRANQAYYEAWRNAVCGLRTAVNDLQDRFAVIVEGAHEEARGKIRQAHLSYIREVKAAWAGVDPDSVVPFFLI